MPCGFQICCSVPRGYRRPAFSGLHPRVRTRSHAISRYAAGSWQRDEGFRQDLVQLGLIWIGRSSRPVAPLCLREQRHCWGFWCGSGSSLQPLELHVAATPLLRRASGPLWILFLARTAPRRSSASLLRFRSSLWWCLACAPRPQCHSGANDTVAPATKRCQSLP